MHPKAFDDLRPEKVKGNLKVKNIDRIRFIFHRTHIHIYIPAI